MTNNAIKTLVSTNKGATLTHNGNKYRLKDGYMVSVKGYERRYRRWGNLFNRLADYKDKAKKLGGYVGLWLHDGYIYLDISKCYKDKAEAIAMGYANKQLSIYDIANDSYINM